MKGFPIRKSQGVDVFNERTRRGQCDFAVRFSNGQAGDAFEIRPAGFDPPDNLGESPFPLADHGGVGIQFAKRGFMENRGMVAPDDDRDLRKQLF